MSDIALIALGSTIGFACGLACGLQILAHRLRGERAKQRKLTLLEAAKLLRVETEETMALRREALRNYDFMATHDEHGRPRTWASRLVRRAEFELELRSKS